MIDELEKLLNSEEGQSLGMLPDGEISCMRPKINMGQIADAILKDMNENPSDYIGEVKG